MPEKKTIFKMKMVMMIGAEQLSTSFSISFRFKIHSIVKS